jgi:primary-amine oxidase
MRRRGITDFGLCMVDLWSAGNFGSDATGQRLSRALTWARAHPADNGYAHPVDGVVTLVDLNAMKVVAVEDHRLVPVPAEDANYTPAAVGTLRADVKPLDTRPDHDLPLHPWRCP